VPPAWMVRGFESAIADPKARAAAIQLDFSDWLLRAIPADQRVDVVDKLLPLLGSQNRWTWWRLRRWRGRTRGRVALPHRHNPSRAFRRRILARNIFAGQSDAAEDIDVEITPPVIIGDFGKVLGFIDAEIVDQDVQAGRGMPQGGGALGRRPRHEWFRPPDRASPGCGR
jgi:hypothetical protein